MDSISNEECLRRLVPEPDARSYPRPAPNRGALLIFTPRSGSSWLCDLLTSTGAFGNPQEWLNQDLLKFSAPRYLSRSEEDHLNAVETFTATPNGRYCIAATWGQILHCATDILARYHAADTIILRRRNILRQAISLYVATTTGHFHDFQSDDGLKEEPSLAWSDGTPGEIARWWGHILNYECLCEVQFAIRKLTPLRLYYEDLVEAPHRDLKRILDYCNVSANLEAVRSTRASGGSAVKRMLEQRFMDEHGDMVAAFAALRPPLST
jgi:LPS sulfotransferase NodH